LSGGPRLGSACWTMWSERHWFCKG